MRQTDEKQRVYSDIYTAIVTLKLPPSTRMVETRLAQALATSRATVRDVLRELSLVGLVEIQPNKGAVVASPTRDEARDIMDMRFILEQESTSQAAQKITAEDIAELEKYIADEQAAIDNDEYAKSLDCSLNFHLKLAKVCGNQFLVKSLQEMLGRSSLVFNMYSIKREGSCHCKEHTDILNLLRKKDHQGARESMRLHLESLNSNLDLKEFDAENVDFESIFSKRISSDVD